MVRKINLIKLQLTFQCKPNRYHGTLDRSESNQILKEQATILARNAGDPDLSQTTEDLAKNQVSIQNDLVNVNELLRMFLIIGNGFFVWSFSDKIFRKQWRGRADTLI